MNPLVVTVTHDVAAPADAVWALLGDTDRFNRATEQGFAFEERKRPDGTVERVGRLSRFGLTMTWTEHPWTFVAPDGFRVLRTFHGGPIDRYTVEVRVTDRGADGSRFTYVLTLTPRWWGWPIAAIETALTTGPKLRAALATVVKLLEGQAVAFDPPPPPLPADALAQLDRGLAAVPAPLAGPLRAHLVEAPLALQRRMSPIALGRRWGLGADDVADGLVAGVHGGALRVRWELRCPRCRGAPATVDRPADLPTDVHCPTCDIRFDGTFPESVAVVFEPSPAVRAVDEPIACAVSPRRTPHVHASLAVERGGVAACEITLAAGTYRIRGPGRAHALVAVDEDAEATEAALRLDDAGITPAVVRLAPGRVSITIDSGASVDASVVIEERWVDPDAYSLARLVARPGGRALLGVVDPEAASGGATRGAMLALSVSALGERAASVATAVIAAQPRWWRADDDLVFALFDKFDDALAVGAEAAGDLRVGAALDVGVWFDVSGTPAGNTVAAVIRGARRVGFGRIVVPAERADDPEITTALAARGLAYAPIPWQGLRPIRVPRRPLPTPPAPVTGDVLGKWRLVTPIAAGGQGAVWDAVDEAGGRAAVKVLRHVGALDPGALQRFWLEARLLSRAKHPGLVQVLGWGTDAKERPWLAMARVDGPDLHSFLAKGPLDARRAALWAADVAGALGALHEAQIVHRDVKPANILLVPVPKSKPPAHTPIVIDLGVAQDLARAEVPGGQSAGTPRFMAPEQLANDPVGPPADVYAVGLVIYDALTGALPWDDGTENAVFRRLREPAPPIGERAKQPVPRPLAEIVAKALARDPAERFADGRALEAALREFVGRWYK